MDFVSQIEPSDINEVIVDEHCSLAMQGELNQYEINNIMKLVHDPTTNIVIETK